MGNYIALYTTYDAWTQSEVVPSGDMKFFLKILTNMSAGEFIPECL
jgi:hypothetical protein